MAYELPEDPNHAGFIGSEFFIWLWHLAEVGDGRFALGDEAWEIGFDDNITLEGQLAEAEQSKLKGAQPAYSPEAHQALQLGKRVSKARLRLSRGDQNWFMTGDSRTLSLSAVKVPSALSAADEGAFAERMMLLEELDRAWHGVYGLFLRDRVAGSWNDILATIKTWIETPLATTRHDEAPFDF
jgi:hypothetical protein